MSPTTKYQLLTVLTVVMFFYLLLTEVTGRWSEIGRLHNELTQRQQTVLNPEELAEKKLRLAERKKSLTSLLTRDSGTFEQSQTGVFEFLNASARKTGVRFESLVPAETESSGEIQEIGFKLSMTSSFHRIGAFVNEVESGAMTVRLQRLDMANRTRARQEEAERTTGKSPLEASLEGVSYIYPKKNLR